MEKYNDTIYIKTSSKSNYNILHIFKELTTLKLEKNKIQYYNVILE